MKKIFLLIIMIREKRSIVKPKGYTIEDYAILEGLKFIFYWAGEWDMHTVTERIRDFNRGRNPQLLRLKYRAMRTDAFAFFRGTCHLFYQDWPVRSQLNQAPTTWLCGDLHWQNFGSFKGNNRLVYFDINDFDESGLGPCTWDLARLLVSILLSASLLHISEKRALELCQLSLKIYQKAVKKGQIRVVEEDQTTGLVHALLFQTRTRDQADLLTKYCNLVEGSRTLHIDGTRLLPATLEQKENIQAAIEQWADSQARPGHFIVQDIAQRVAGIGSLGMERYVLLVSGKGSPDHNYLLDLKAEGPSSLSPYFINQQPHWSSQAERVVTIQHWVQNMPPALLTAIQIQRTSFVLRELQPEEDKVNIEPLGGKLSRLEELVETIAKVVAWGQLHSGGHQGSATANEVAGYLSEAKWQYELLQYANSYLGQVKKDYHAFCAAYDSGAFTI
jgi:uncharacterized protein (DUF2252 family)